MQHLSEMVWLLTVFSLLIRYIKLYVTHINSVNCREKEIVAIKKLFSSDRRRRRISGISNAMQLPLNIKKYNSLQQKSEKTT